MSARSPTFARFVSHRGALLGAALVALVVAFAAFGPALVGHDPNLSDFAHGRTPDGTPAPPGAAHWLGADALFRDVASRLAHGARLSLVIALAATTISLVLGGAVGVVAGWWAGRPFFRGPVRVGIDDVLMRAVDVGLAFPFLLLVMAIGAAVDRTDARTILLVLGLTGWLGTARLVRAKTLALRGLEFVTAARAVGARTPHVLLWHVVPHVVGTLVVIGTMSIAQMILAESVLSWLGVGIEPPTATLGRMLHEGESYLGVAPWLVAAPGALIVVAVLGFHLVGEGLRHALDAEGD